MRSFRKILQFILIFLGLFTLEVSAQDILNKFNPFIEKGEYTKVQSMMLEEIASNPKMKPLDRLTIEFEIERLERIRKNFTKTKGEVVSYVRKYIPNVSEKEIKQWEKEKSLEWKIIDGKKLYFRNAASNLFLIDRKAKVIKEAYDRSHGEIKKGLYSFVEDAKRIIEAAETLNTPLVKPKKFKMIYTLTVKPDAVPDGEVIRAWLPYPREGHQRQVDVTFYYSIPNKHIISDNDKYKQRTIYLEKKAKRGEPTVFKVCFGYKSYAQYYTIDPDRVQPYDTTSAFYKKYTAEQPPHIVFTEKLRAVSKEIIGDETNPFLKAKKIFQWVDERTPWASAREYSTIRNISMYAFENKHGDCGIQTLLFTTLARMNGISVHWQSGWWGPPQRMGLHDWCEMYIEPYDWLLVDQSFGIKKSDDERLKWFCLGNSDSYRMILNDDISQSFYPAKIFPRSDTVDFQRGEVEWRGGNLYFDQWDYDLKAEEVE